MSIIKVSPASAGLTLFFLFTNANTFACSSEDRIAMAQMGQTTEQIDAQCGSGGNPFVTPSMPTATQCVTPAGSCYLGVQLSVGSQCYCPSGYGNVVYGVAQ